MSVSRMGSVGLWCLGQITTPPLLVSGQVVSYSISRTASELLISRIGNVYLSSYSDLRRSKPTPSPYVCTLFIFRTDKEHGIGTVLARPLHTACPHLMSRTDKTFGSVRG